MTAFVQHDATFWRCDGCGLEAYVATIPLFDFWHVERTAEGARHHCPDCAERLGLADVDEELEQHAGVSVFGP